MRRTETVLGYVTIGFLVVYAPVETIYSWKGGLLDPFYIVDLIAMALMLSGVIRSLRARPRSAPALMTVGWAWAGANFWRALFDRVRILHSGGQIGLGSVEMVYVTAQLIVALLCLGVGLWLVRQGEG